MNKYQDFTKKYEKLK